MKEHPPIDIDSKKKELEKVLQTLRNQNYYERLGVSKTASANQVSKAFKSLAKKYHPDLYAKHEELRKICSEILTLINEANDVLSDDKKKARYDINMIWGGPKNGDEKIKEAQRRAQANQRAAETRRATAEADKKWREQEARRAEEQRARDAENKRRADEEQRAREAETKRREKEAQDKQARADQAAREKAERERVRAEQERELGPKIAACKNLDELLNILRAEQWIFTPTQEINGGMVADAIDVARKGLKDFIDPANRRSHLEREFKNKGVTNTLGIRDRAIALIIAEWEEEDRKASAQNNPADQQPPEPKPQDQSHAEGRDGKPKSSVEKFIDEFGLRDILPPIFENLNEAQKLKVIEDLQKRIVDIVKSDVEKEYSEQQNTWSKEWKGKIIAAGRDIVTKNIALQNKEHRIFEELKNTPEGRELIRKDLELLTEKNLGRDITLNAEGKPVINFINPNTIENITPQELKLVAEFNAAANAFTKIPYEWGQESVKIGQKGARLRGHKLEYERAEKKFNKALLDVLKIKEARETKGQKGKSLVEIMEVENAVQIEQLLNTDPEAEQALANFSKGAGVKTFGKDFVAALNNLTGRNMINRALIAGGWGARTLARGAAAATQMTGLSLFIGMGTGGLVGGIRGFFRGKETLTERKKSARYGKEDKSAEAEKVVSAKNMASHIERILEDLNNPTISETKRTALLKRLQIRIDVAQEKIAQGLMNFGDAKSTLENQFALTKNLNRAIATVGIFEKDVRANLDERINKILSFRQEQIDAAQEKFINNKVLRGAALGASLALGGYTVRWIGEKLGWWDWVGEKIGWGDRAETAAKGGAPKADSQEAFVKRADQWLNQKPSVEHTHTSAPTAAAVHEKPETPASSGADRAAASAHEASPGNVTDNSFKTSSPATESPVEAPAKAPEPTPNAAVPNKVPTAPEIATVDAATTASPEINFEKSGVTFEKGKGAIQGIIDLKNQMREMYHNDFSKAPQSIQDFMKETNATKQAINLGLFDPEKAKESALIREGYVLKFDEKGELLFGKPDAAGNIPKLGDTKWEMFDSDRSGAASAATKAPEASAETPNADFSSTEQPVVNMEQAAALRELGYKGDPNDADAVEEFFRTRNVGSETATETSEAWRRGEYGNETVSEEERLAKMRQNLERHYENEARRAAYRGEAARTPDQGNNYRMPFNEKGEPVVQGYNYDQAYAEAAHRGYNLGNPYDPKFGRGNIYGYSPERGGYLHYFADLDQTQENILNYNQEFAKNPYNLTGKGVWATYEAHLANVRAIFGNENSIAWNNLKNVSAARALEIESSNETETRLGDYLRALRKETGLRPISRWFGLKKESVSQYIARALQKLAYEGKLEEFQRG